MNNGELGEILLVEDNPGDILLAQKAMQRAEVFNKLQVAQDGEAALEFLKKVGQEGHPSPQLILLDINIPKLSGLEVLSYIKQSAHLRHIPVVMLTSSEAERDVAAAYDLHANSFISKPLDLASLVTIMCDLKRYWFEVVLTPGVSKNI